MHTLRRHRSRAEQHAYSMAWGIPPEFESNLGLFHGPDASVYRGLCGKTQSVIADFRRIAALGIRDQFGHGEPAPTSLARAHPAAQKGFHLVRPRATAARELRDLGRANLLAAAR